MQIRTSVVPTRPASLQLGVTQHKHGPSLHKLLCVSRSSVPRALAEPSLQQYQENAGCAPLHEVVDPPQVQTLAAPNEGALDLSIPERLRRLARGYISNPDSTVNGVHLEPGPSGRFQVVITIDIGDILGDTTN